MDVKDPGGGGPRNVFDKRLFAVTDTEMVSYMDAHFKSTACPQCGNDAGWSMDGDDPADNDGLQLMRIYRMPYADKATIFRPFFIMSCEACGSARQIMADHVMAWKNSLPKELP